jgi:predicted transcriptional regulator
MAKTKRFLVYVASNHKGLESERYEVTRQLARMGILCCGFPCRDDTSPYDWNLARSQIEDADLFIMLLGDEYGPMAPTGISYLHRELVHAQSLAKPVLSFVKNSLPAQQQTEDQRRLAGFHGVVSKGVFRLWHLREELIAQVKTSVVNALSNKIGGWLKLNSLDKGAEIISEAPAEIKVDSKQWMLKTRQMMRLQFSAKVYEAGNNTLEEISVSLRWDAIFASVGVVMKAPSSEDRLRAVLEALVEVEVKRRLLQQHPSSHAVDDIRINREQFQSLLKQWLECGLITKNLRGARSAWQLTSEGERRIAMMSMAGQVV